MSLSPGRFSPPVHTALTEMLAQRAASDERPLAVFDWDNTCISGDIGEAVLRHLDACGHHPGCVARYEELCETYDKTVGYQYCAETLGGLSHEDAEALITGVIDEHLASGDIRLRPEIHDLMNRMRDAGWDVWVVTASAEPIVEVFAAHYDVPRDRVIGMQLERTDEGIEPRLVGPITYRQGKVDAIDQRIGRRPTFAAGDALTDYEMLHSAQHVLLFDNGDEELLQSAGERGWMVQTPF